MKSITLFSIFLLSVSSVILQAQDRVFAVNYQSNVLNKGDFDLEYQNKIAFGKKGKFSPYLFGKHLDQRLEFEIGLGKNIQTAFYFNHELFSFVDTTSSVLQQEIKPSLSTEWKWKISDPVANGIGMALYEEVEVGGNNLESETKLIFDKRWLNDLLVLNLTGVYEIEKEVEVKNNNTVIEDEVEMPFDVDLSYLHFMSSGFGVGFESGSRNNINKEDGWMNSLLFIGPAIHVASQNFFLNLCVQKQLTNLHKTVFALGSLDLNSNENVEVRLVTGFSF